MCMNLVAPNPHWHWYVSLLVLRRSSGCEMFLSDFLMIFLDEQIQFFDEIQLSFFLPLSLVLSIMSMTYLLIPRSQKSVLF